MKYRKGPVEQAGPWRPPQRSTNLISITLVMLVMYVDGKETAEEIHLVAMTLCLWG